MEDILSPRKLHDLSPRSSTITAFELLLVGLVSTLLAWYVQFLWRRRKWYLHASKMPGPFALPVIGCAMHFVGSPYDIFKSIMSMFNTYPGIFRVWFGPRLFYAVSDPKYYEILLPNCLRKEPLYSHAEPIVGHGLFTAPVDTWKRHRKLISPTFNQKILDGFMDVFTEQADVLLEQLKNFIGKKEFDLFHVISKCTLDTICETAMGVKVNAQTTNALFTKWVDKMLSIVFLRIFVLWYHYDSIFKMTSLSKVAEECRMNIHKFSGSVVRQKKRAFELKKQLQLEYGDELIEDEPRRKAFLDYLIEIAYSEKGSFNERELREEVDTFIVAGSDTTASTLCFTFTMLGLHPELQDKVYREVVDVLGPERPPEPSDLPKLKYMELFIKETLRLFPIAGFVVRAVDEDIDLGDHIIPEGASVVFGFLRTHTSEEYWPDPFKFIPERFLPEEVAKRHPCAYLPFSYGSRNCIGQRYAMMAIKSILSAVVRKYKISTSYKSIEEIELKCNLILRPKDGYKVFIEPRSLKTYDILP